MLLVVQKWQFLKRGIANVLIGDFEALHHADQLKAKFGLAVFKVKRNKFGLGFAIDWPEHLCHRLGV